MQVNFNINLKKVGIVVAGAALVATVAACQSGGGSGSTKSDQHRSAATLNALDKSQPVPQFNWSQIRQTLIDAETAQADTTVTTSFFFVQGVPNPVFTCPSIGFPVPGTFQITNPDQAKWDEPNDNTPYTLPQIDPNGVYGGDTAATYVLCTKANGQVYLHHAEEFVHTVAGPATWDETTHSIQITGDPTFKPKVGKVK